MDQIDKYEERIEGCTTFKQCEILAKNFRENGFIPISIFKEGESEEKVLEELTLLIEKKEYRQNLFEKLLKFEFHKTKKNVLNKLIELLPNEQ